MSGLVLVEKNENLIKFLKENDIGYEEHTGDTFVQKKILQSKKRGLKKKYEEIIRKYLPITKRETGTVMTKIQLFIEPSKYYLSILDECGRKMSLQQNGELQIMKTFLLKASSNFAKDIREDGMNNLRVDVELFDNTYENAKFNKEIISINS